MRISIRYFFACSVIIASCSNQSQKTIHFEPMQGTFFNFMADSTFMPPNGDAAMERKRAFDSCMGEGYEPNAIFLKTKDTFYIGSIVNRNTMKVVKNIPFNSLTNILQASALVRFIERPCYDKIKLNISPSNFMNTKIDFIIPGAADNVNKEFNDLFNNSKDAELEMSFWVNVEFTDMIGKILDTTTNTNLLDYKKFLTDTANMVLIRSTSVTITSFYINTNKSVSASLQQALVNKPLVSFPDAEVKTYLSQVNDHRLKVEFNGIFQIMGQFMQAKEE